MRDPTKSLSQSAGRMKRPAFAGTRAAKAKVGRVRKRSTPLGELLRAWRKRYKFSQVIAADKLKVSPRTLQNWEQGHREPRGFAAEQLREKIR